MAKDYEAITKYELLKGLENLEKAGALKKPKEEVLQEVILNTQKAYISHGKETQPVNARLAKEQSIKNLKKAPPPLADSKVLRANMVKANRALPAGTDAHHIVPGKENRPWARDNSAAARAILRRWGIDINHEANGVALPSDSKVSVTNLPNAYPHKKVHTKVYYLNIAGQLGNSKSKTDCLNILREIGEELEDGTYPIR